MSLSLLKPALALAAVFALAGCAAPPVLLPSLGLRLAPADLQTAVSVQQHLKVERGGRIDELDVALEVDGERLDLVALAFGQRVMSVHYDGAKLTEWRHAMLPAQVRADAVLQDLQLTLWPQASLAAALPAGWSVTDADLLRTLRFDGAVIATVRYSGMPRWSGTVVLDNLRHHYRLTIVSVPSP